MEGAERAGAGATSGDKRRPEQAAAATKRRRSFLPAIESQGTTVLHKTVSYALQPLPARHFDRDTTEPISFYLSSLEELLAWKPTGDDDFNVATMPLAKRQPPLHSKRPRTLVCHDMKNGYLEDRFIQGSASRDPYIFYHWQYIDIFVYFSHHTVTIPPVTWTNAAHRNGVSVLGTFITEWTDGGKLCESFLAGEADGYCAVAEQLVHIASFYCFDGWLVNIENRLSEAAVRNLPFFLRHLRERLQRVLPGGLVLWYDSVLQSGELKWQNELNEKNRVFFDACDGLFTNYNWQEEHLERTRAQAGERLADVYVGVDVFARGEVVGGGFETDKVLGFADGAAAHSQHRHAAFQHLLLPGHGHGTVLGWAGGRSRALVQSERPGDPTPLHRPPSRAGDGWLAAHVLLPAGRLERGQLPADRGGHPPCRGPRGCPMPAPPRLVLSLQYKLEESPEVAVALELSTRDTDVSALPGPATRHQPQPLGTLPSRLSGLLPGCGRQGTTGWVSRCYELELRNCALQDLSLILSRRQPGPHERRFSCRLGELRVLDAACLHSSAPRVPSLEAAQLLWHKDPGTDQLSLSLTLRWSYPPSQAHCFRIHCQGTTRPGGRALPLPEQPHLLGLAYAPVYRVVGLAVPGVSARESCQVEFFVEPVLNEGLAVDRSRWGRLMLVYSDQASTNT
ncbi:cytosolic endo-beta-N-acetylglucosaminidase isoform X4 [Emydura macquarii macquarii]|uniref:cytosolic endo-beta-N-acetylglucosaminidase isoform X4 n=1 Tax=Emydura macquarii macquarii TaxID=1129001 RepID=UPI00352BB43D